MWSSRSEGGLPASIGQKAPSVRKHSHLNDIYHSPDGLTNLGLAISSAKLGGHIARVTREHRDPMPSSLELEGNCYSLLVEGRFSHPAAATSPTIVLRIDAWELRSDAGTS